MAERKEGLDPKQSDEAEEVRGRVGQCNRRRVVHANERNRRMRQIGDSQSQRLNSQDLVHFSEIASVPFDASGGWNFVVCRFALSVRLAASAIVKRGGHSDSTRCTLTRDQRPQQQQQ